MRERQKLIEKGLLAANESIGVKGAA